MADKQIADKAEPSITLIREFRWQCPDGHRHQSRKAALSCIEDRPRRLKLEERREKRREAVELRKARWLEWQRSDNERRAAQDVNSVERESA